jgi:hypothetical protein
MSVDDTKDFTITLSGAPLSWWDQIKAQWNKLKDWEKAVVVAAGGAATIGAGYEITKKPKKA